MAGAESFEQRPVRTCHLVSGEGIDGLWGDLGVMLPNSSEYRWVPITATSADRIEVEARKPNMLEEQPHSLMAQSLNGRLLWVNLTAVKCVSLCHEGDEWPEPSVDQERSPGRRQVDLVAHPGHQIPLVVSDVLTEFVRTGEWTDDVSERLRVFVDGFLESRRENLSDDTLRRLLLTVRCWMIDGSVLWIDASPASMAEAIADLEVGAAAGLVSLVDNEEGFVSQNVSLKQVAMLEFPAALISGSTN
ncbi:MAG: hypothetical protein RH942_03850 [Kiloniellaceae bacterium]